MWTLTEVWLGSRIRYQKLSWSLDLLEGYRFAVYTWAVHSPILASNVLPLHSLCEPEVSVRIRIYLMGDWARFFTESLGGGASSRWGTQMFPSILRLCCPPIEFLRLHKIMVLGRVRSSGCSSGLFLPFSKSYLELSTFQAILSLPFHQDLYLLPHTQKKRTNFSA